MIFLIFELNLNWKTKAVGDGLYYWGFLNCCFKQFTIKTIQNISANSKTKLSASCHGPQTHWLFREGFQKNPLNL